MITVSTDDIDGDVTKVHVFTKHVVDFGRVTTDTHLRGMEDKDFIVRKYEDKNKTISAKVQAVGNRLLGLRLFYLAEQYWKQVDESIIEFNMETGRRVNRGIPLGNIGVVQIVQGKIVEGLSSIHSAYEDDRDCLKHLPGTKLDAETELGNSKLYTQFENHTLNVIYNDIIVDHKKVFKRGISKKDLSSFISSLRADRKLILYTILYRFVSALSSDHRHTSFISRTELLRSLSDLAVWFEYELKKKTKNESGTLFKILADRSYVQFKIKLNSTKGEYNNASTLDVLHQKIKRASSTPDPVQVQNARIAGCVRNFAGHNLEVTTHVFFTMCDQVFARILSLMMYAKTREWI